MTKKLFYFVLPFFIFMIMGAQSKSGPDGDLIDTSIFITNSIKINSPKAYAYARIATEFAKDGQREKAEKMFGKAIETAKKIKNEGYKAFAYGNIAAGLAQTGKIDKAIEIANKIKNEGYKIRAYSDIGFELAKTGKTDKAIEIANKIKNEKNKAWDYANIASELAKCYNSTTLNPEQKSELAKKVMTILNEEKQTSQSSN